MSETSQNNEGIRWLFPVLLVGGILIVVRLVVLLGTPLTLHGDEAQYWTWAQSFELGYYSKPPLIAWVIGMTTSVCGDAAWCVRLPATLLHFASAIILSVAARDFVGANKAAWVGIVWLTLPAVSFSSLIMSTDTLLLFCWVISLWAYFRLLDADSQASAWRPAIVLAAGLALGVNAKYAMVYFLICIAIHVLIEPGARAKVRELLIPFCAAILAGLAGLIPNVVWNASNGWATLGHTADNANWQGPLVHFDELGEFFISQFAVFGPILFVALLLAIPRNRAMKGWRSPIFRMLLAFSLPILIIVCTQAFLSRANANWAAVAYPSAAILVTALLIRWHHWWLRGAVALHVTVAAILYLAVLMPERTAALLNRDPFEDLSGWQEIADDVAALAEAEEVETILMDNRLFIATLAYTMRNEIRAEEIEIRTWNHDAKIDHHYEMAWLYEPARDGDRVILLTPHGVEPYELAFDRVEDLDDLVRVDLAGEGHPLHLRILEGQKQ